MGRLQEGGGRREDGSYPQGGEGLAAKEGEMRISGLCAEMLRNCALLTSLWAHLGTACGEQKRSSVSVFHPIDKYPEPLSVPGPGLGPEGEVPALLELIFW